MVTQKYINRLWEQVEKTETCWLWTGSMNGHGYGTLHTCTNGKPKMYMVHRVTYELAKGVIPPKLVIDHLCRITNCVNPDHLEAVTDKVNVLRGIGKSAIRARQTHCVNGHEFTQVNTYRRPGGNNRACIICRNVHQENRRVKELLYGKRKR